ncbi:glucose 1-dehydrogenase [Leifsonia shinshuensis]|uniref:glucose 1-dehydrogenase n=1 Tax=Leifsonia shinshuensis TaxID=150026 RepID=UPI00285C8FB5|nr:glucose 1-dehydrogenase [Leifsonia shinshuensis]MDR6971796.1 glucose 1-dehydrogenase [Leifsonia shinshuensis]
MELSGKSVVVTGGNSGIGAAIVRSLAAAGAAVVIDYVAHPEDTADLVKEVTAGGGRAIGVEADASTTAGIDKLIQTAVDEFGRLDAYVNNAGVEKRHSLLEVDEKTFHEVMTINLKSAVFGTQRAAQRFIAQGGGGVVVNVSSVHEDWPMPGNLSYCVSKGGMRMLTRTAGVELGPQGVRVVSVAPGAVNTPINAATMKDDSLRQRLENSIPLREVAEPSQIGDVVAFVVSDAAKYMTATTVFVDGGIMHGSVGL